MQRVDHTWLTTEHQHLPVRCRVKDGRKFAAGICVQHERLPNDDDVDVAHKSWLIGFVHMACILDRMGVEWRR